MKMSAIDTSTLPEKYTMAKSSRECNELWLPYWVHCLDVASVMDYLLKYWVSKAEQKNLRKRTDGVLTSEEMFQVGRFLSLTHDIGKVTMEFQSMITASSSTYSIIQERQCAAGLIFKRKENPKHHSLLGQRILLRFGKDTPNVSSFACIIGAHHGEPSESAYSGELPYDPGGQWRLLQDQWLDYAMVQSGFSSLSGLPFLSQEAQVLWTGLLIMSDWIASNERYFPLISLESDGSNINYPVRVKNGLSKLHLTHPWIPEDVWDFSMLYQERFGFDPNSVQTMMAHAVSMSKTPGIYILEAQMGVGKTEAALCAAEAIGAKTMLSGVYFGLPTQATANGIFGRIKDWAGQQSSREQHTIRLAHGSAALNEEYNSLLEGSANTDESSAGIFVNPWFSGRKQSLLSDFVVGTVDQLLLAGLKQKHVMLRHLGLSNKIIIVDECHAYDAYMDQYLETVLRWLGAYHVPVILLSATLPADRRRDFILAYQNKNPRRQKEAAWMKSNAYPLLTWSDGDEVFQETISSPPEEHLVRLDLPAWDPDDFTSLAYDLKSKLQDGGCAAVIVNTVRRAQACAAVLRDIFPSDEIQVIHAQYLMPDRANREKQLVSQLGKKAKIGSGRPYRLIVVGTQILEQSLDIDCDYMVTDLCPMDLLLQRIGRLHRHAGRIRPAALTRPQCQILCVKSSDLESGATAIYGAYLLLRTQALLQQRTQISLPSEISPLVQMTYDPLWDPPNTDDLYVQAKRTEELRQKDQKQRARVYCLPDPDEEESDLYDWLGTCYHDTPTDSTATAAVRDGDPSVDVLCLKWGPSHKLYFMNDNNFHRPLPTDVMPSEDDAKEIARQTLRLPHFLCAPYSVRNTIDCLESQTRSAVAEWQYSPWLRGELLLIFDEANTAKIGNWTLRYSSENGLEIEKEEL